MRRSIGFAFLCLCGFALSGCDLLTSPDARGPSPQLTGLPRSLSVHEVEVVRANNAFAFDILRETLREDDSPNIFLSPLSASMALGMTMNGARGETLDGMRRALGVEALELEQINASYRDLIDLLLGLDRGVDMRIANSIWALEGVPFRDSFLQTSRDAFDARISTLDFGSPDAASTINRWVEEKTGGRIDEIVDDPISPDVVMYLINAIYFQGDWRHRFDRSLTRDAPFLLDDGDQTTVRMMERTGPHSIHHDPVSGALVVDLPYSQGAFSMTIVLPSAQGAVDALIEGLNPGQWEAWTDALTESELRFAMPRFRLEYETLMNGPLIELGMGPAFGRHPGADFSGMMPGADIRISEVKQKTFIEVDENGTEAAAATSVEMVRTSLPATLSVDRPFLVAIRERFSGTILFLGRIGAPESP